MVRSVFSVVVTLIAASCGGPPAVSAVAPVPSTTHPAKSPEVELVVANAETVRFVKTTPTGLIVTRTVTLPGPIAALAWAGSDPVVMINGSEVGHISSAGYAPYPPVLEAMWTVPQPDPLSDHIDKPLWQLIVDATGVVWQARCEWGPGRLKNGEIICDAWVYARRSVGRPTISRIAPTAASEPGLPAIEPSTTTRVEIAAAATGDKSILRCTEAGTTIEFPPEEQRDFLGRLAFVGVSDLTWIATAPPVFRITEVLASERVDVIFEGCAVTGGDVHIVPGPQETIAILNGDQFSVRRHGHEVGTLDGVSLVGFAPTW